MRQGPSTIETQLPKKRQNRSLDSIDSKKDKYIYKRSLNKTEQNLIQNYFEYLGKRKNHFMKLDKSLEANVWHAKSQPHFKEFLKIINETFDMNKDYDTKELDKQKLKVDKVIEDLERFIIEPKEVSQVAQIEKSKTWDEGFNHLMSSISSMDRIKRLELVSKIRQHSSISKKA